MEEVDDVEYRIDMVKNRIADKRIKKTKKENDYLKQKLAELEQELAELEASSSESEEYVAPKRTPKQTKQKPIRIPKENVERLNTKTTMMTREELMRSFGF